MLKKHYLTDNSLSLKAKGLLAILLSKKVSRPICINKLRELSNNEIQTYPAVMKELISAGYVKKTLGTDYIVNESFR